MTKVSPQAEVVRVKRLGWLIAACAVTFIAIYVILIRTSAGQQLVDWALIGNTELTHTEVRRASLTLHHITGPTVVVFALLLVAIGLLRRQPRIAFFGAGGFLIAVAAAEALKRLLPRPLLDSRWEQDLIDKTMNTFPSGHVTIVTAFVLVLTLVSAPRARALVAAVGSVLVVLVGIGVVIAGWHRPEDSMGGALLAAVTICATSILLVQGRAIESPTKHTLTATFGAGVVSLAAVALVLFMRRDGAVLPSGVGAYAFPVSLAAVAVVCLVVIQVVSRSLCVPARTRAGPHEGAS